MNTNTPIITLAAATKVFGVRNGQACHALRGISLNIARGEYVAVLEKSGSNTSTLLNQIAGQERPTSGVFQVAVTELADMSETRWLFGGVLQFFACCCPRLPFFAMPINKE
ncbi:MAG: ATP-binding cassette domain-containing protein [Burkholderiaceae bacterium]|nr:ATP-binding cassette domain-containing protein [Burkholderiaceae bacterium]